ncbi:hypothetical protein FQN52_003268 [Onygenales sp. PD_12]|nr:hypothetical protein FQN52_003268 [Onygenales sp. PD_12]
MPTPAESNACSACARSKRKCGRQMPSCARCAERNISCIYPPSRSRAAPPYQPLLPDTSVEDDGLLAEAALADDLMLDLASFPLMDVDFAALSSLTQPPTSAPATNADWFLAPETWRIANRADHPVTVAVGKATMKKYIAVLQSWFDRWATTGSNPFIHPRLYSTTFPACVQVAYAALASYIHRTPANTDTVLQIIEDRSTDLLQENGAVLSLDRSGAEQWTDREADGDIDIDIDIDTIDLFAQLSRLHALMVYQLIGLFDGDIRSRYVAQTRMSVLDSWTRKLFRSAERALALPSININTHSHSHTHADTADTAATHLIGCLPRPSTPSQQQWYLWILSESIRRTWLVAVSLSPVFSALQRRCAACPGGIMYTNRSGVWDAASAAEWERECVAGGEVGFLQRFEGVRLFEEVGPGEVDEFGMAMLDMTFDGEVLGGWRGGGGRGIRV